MEKFKAFLKRKDIEISLKRYGIDALGAMAQGLFCSLLIGTIINTIGTQFHIPFLTMAVATVNDTQYTVGSLASAMSGPAMAVAIGYALHCPPLVLFSLITVGFASNALGGAGGPLAVLFVAIVAAEIGKAVSKETKIDILVTPLVTIGVGPKSLCHKFIIQTFKKLIYNPAAVHLILYDVHYNCISPSLSFLPFTLNNCGNLRNKVSYVSI